MAFRKFATTFAPPIAGVAVGWSLWSIGEYVAPEQMHGIAASIHGTTYHTQQWLLDSCMPRETAQQIRTNYDNWVIPPPLAVQKKMEADKDQAQAGSMFRDVFEQCRLNESLDWLEENATEDIPFLYINELFATWGSMFFWKHFLRANKSSSISVASDIKTLQERIEHDTGVCAVHVLGGDEESQLLPHRIDIKAGGEAALIEGIWHRFAVTRQLDPTAGWASLAVLTQEPRNALALASIALVSSQAAKQSEAIPAVFGRSVVVDGDGDSAASTSSSRGGDNKNVLCSADRCVWALASLLHSGLRMWGDEDSVAMVSEAHLKVNKNNSGKGQQQQSGIFSWLTGGGGSTEEPQSEAAKLLERRQYLRPFLMAESEHSEHIREVLGRFEERLEERQRVKQEQQQKTQQQQKQERHAGFEGPEIEQRWAVAASDPFLVTLRNVDNALCDYLKRGAEQPRWYNVVDYWFSSEEKRCPVLRSSSATECSSSSLKREDVLKAMSMMTNSNRPSLMPVVRAKFQHNGNSDQTAPLSNLYDDKGKWLLGDYVGQLFATAAPAGMCPSDVEVPANGSKSASSAVDKLALDEAVDLLEHQASVVREWVREAPPQ